MPEYLYRCRNGHDHTETHPMTKNIPIIECPVCKCLCWRVPQPVLISWGGCKPSNGDIPQAARELREHASENRENYERIHNG